MAQIVPPRFEFASIEPLLRASYGQGGVTTSQGGIPLGRYSLSTLIYFAFDLWVLQLKGPEWLETQLFNLEARTSGSATKEEVRLMLQTLLIERFKLVTHWETKAVSGFVLVETKDGHRLSPAPPDMRPTHGQFISGGHKRLFGILTMDEFARLLQGSLRTPVQNQTEVSGLFQIYLGYSKDETGTTLFTNVQEQLGLMLEARQIDFKFFVVDHAERTPTEN